MESLFKFVKECISYFFGGEVKEELLTMLNNNNETITPEVKQDLISSIMEDKPNQFVAKLNDKRNHIPDNLKENLMASVMRASKMYVNPVEKNVTTNTTPKETVVETEETIDEPPVYSMTPEILEDRELDTPPLAYEHNHDDIEIPPLDDITLGDEERTETPFTTVEPDVIHTGKIIPSDQFVPIHTPIPHVTFHNIPVVRNWDNVFMHEIEHINFREFRKIRREQANTIHTGKIIPSDQFVSVNKPIFPVEITIQTPKLNPERMNKRESERRKFREFRQAMRDGQNIIHTSKIIPSEQFVPVRTEIQTFKIDVVPVELDPERVKQRENARKNLRDFIQARRESLETIHTGKIIPSGQFKPYNTPINLYPLPVYPEHTLDWTREIKRSSDRFDLKLFIRERRTAIQERMNGVLTTQPIVCAPKQEIYKPKEGEVIHTGKIIPSDQFKPYNNFVYEFIPFKPFIIKDYLREYHRREARRLFREFRKLKRAEMKYSNSWRYDTAFVDIQYKDEFGDVVHYSPEEERHNNNIYIARHRHSRYTYYNDKPYTNVHNRRHDNDKIFCFADNKNSKRNYILKMEHKWNQHF